MRLHIVYQILSNYRWRQHHDPHPNQEAYRVHHPSVWRLFFHGGAGLYGFHLVLKINDRRNLFNDPKHFIDDLQSLFQISQDFVKKYFSILNFRGANKLSSRITFFRPII